MDETKHIEMHDETSAFNTINALKKLNDALILTMGDIDFSGDDDVLNRMRQRNEIKALEIQTNIDKVIKFASDELQYSHIVSEAPVNKDWMHRFFSIVEGVSTENLQYIWGKILAGEIKQPDSFSLRTLDVIRNLSSFEAQLVERMANLVIRGMGHYIIHRHRSLSHHGLFEDYVSLLMEAGIIQAGLNSTLSTNAMEGQTTKFFYGGLALLITNKPEAYEYPFPVYYITTAGKEILKLIEVKLNIDYFINFGKEMKQVNNLVRYKTGSIEMSEPDSEGNYTIL